MQPAVRIDRRACRLRIVEILEQQLVIADQHLARLACWLGHAVAVDDPDLRAGNRGSDGIGDALHRIAGQRVGRRTAAFGHAVAGRDFNVRQRDFKPLHEIDRHDRAAGRQEAEARQIPVAPVRMGEHLLEHGRRRRHHRDAIVLHQVEDADRVVGFGPKHGAAGHQPGDPARLV